MGNDNDISHGRHCVCMMHVHVVFVVKYRRRVFDAQPPFTGLFKTSYHREYWAVIVSVVC